MKLEIIFENSDFIAVNKPAGVLVHGIYDKYGPRRNEKTLADYVVEKYPEVKNVGDKPQERPGVVHRLDRDTSGVILFARKQASFEYLKSLFAAGTEIKKTYITLVWGRMKNQKGIINKPISIRNGSVRRTVHGGRMTREAITNYEVEKYFKTGEDDEFTLLKVQPKTGRTHQIRVHFNAIHHSVYGDQLYGKKRDIFELGRHFLHAQSLRLPLESGERVEIVAKLPNDLEKVLKALEQVSQ